MANDITKAGLWADADVYYSTDLAATLPANASTPFNGSWHQIGLLDGDAGFEAEGKFQTINDHYGWGGVLIATTRSQWKETKKFSVLEDNQYTRALIYPGSNTGERAVPSITNVKLAFETRNFGKVHRLITRLYAQVEVDGTIKEDENDLTTVGLIATVFPDSNKVLYDEQATPTLTSIAITPLTLALTVGQIKTLVATATYSDTSTAVVTNTVAWSSSDITKATAAAGGFVTGVATGTASVSCTLAGITSTAPSVATVS